MRESNLAARECVDLFYRYGPSCFQTFRLRALPASPLRGIESVSAIGRLPHSGDRCWNRFRFIGCTSLRILLFVAALELEQALFASRNSILSVICSLSGRFHPSFLRGERAVGKGRRILGCDWCDIHSDISSM